VIEIGPLALGCAPLGGLFEPVGDAEALATVDAAWAAGIRAFDVAPRYGFGLAEQRLGAALAGRPRDEFVISTKVGWLLEPRRGTPPPEAAMYPGAPPLDPVADYSRDGVLRSLEASLERLALERVDIALIHDPDDNMEAALEHAYPALAELRAQGVVRAIGAGMNQAPALTRFVRETDIDCVLVAGRYTLLDRSAGDKLLAACRARGVAAIAAGVFNSGVLADPWERTTYDYRVAPADIVARARRIAEICAAHGVPVAAAAMAFPLRHPAVAAVLVGARSPAELWTDAELFAAELPDALWAELDADVGVA
jgi:D-threo-aldose 1-dehydrogenase